MRVLSPIFAPAQASPIAILNTRSANALPKLHHYHLTSRAAAPDTKTVPPPNSLKTVRWWQTHPQLLQAAQKHFSHFYIRFSAAALLQQKCYLIFMLQSPSSPECLQLQERYRERAVQKARHLQHHQFAAMRRCAKLRHDEYACHWHLPYEPQSA